MRISQAALKSLESKDKTNNKRALLPMVPETKVELTKKNSVAVDIATNPADFVNSPKVKFYALRLEGHESVRTILKWRQDMIKIFVGMNIVTGHNQALMAESMMNGTPLTLFQARVATLAEEAREAAAEAANANQRNAIRAQPLSQHTTTEHVGEGLRHVVTNILPRRILPKVKRYIRRECRKPSDMKVRTYMQHLLRINLSELPELPPFRDTNSITNDELLDIILYGTPKSWQNEMERQGFDPMEHTLNEVITFMERIEATEEFEGRKGLSKGTSSNAKNSKKRAQDSEDSSQKYCMLHGYGNHSTEECKAVQAMIKRRKTTKGKDGDNDDRKPSFKNKTWNRKASEAKKQTRKDLAAFIKKTVKDKVQKELSAIDKKRAAESDDSSDEFDLNALDGELKNFNYSDMENLHINSDEEDNDVSSDKDEQSSSDEESD